MNPWAGAPSARLPFAVPGAQSQLLWARASNHSSGPSQVIGVLKTGVLTERRYFSLKTSGAIPHSTTALVRRAKVFRMNGGP